MNRYDKVDSIPSSAHQRLALVFSVHKVYLVIVAIGIANLGLGMKPNNKEVSSVVVSNFHGFLTVNYQC